MDRTAAVRSKDLSPEARTVLAGILNVDLSDPDDVITVSVSAHDARESERTAARRRLLGAIERIGERTKGVPDEEIDAAIDEAMQFVRSRPR